MIYHQCFKNYSIVLIFIFSIIIPSFSQSETTILNELEKVDEKIDQRDYDEAKLLLKKVELSNYKLTLLEKYALDLRVAKVQHYADDNNSLINHILANLDKINKMETSDLQYDYLTFTGQMFKEAKKFKKSITYNKLAFINAEKRKDTLDIIYSCLQISSSFYRGEYEDTSKYYKNELDSSLFYYKKALRFPENQYNNKFFTRIYDNLSKIEQKKGNINLAEEYANKALKINQDINNSFGIAISLTNLSSISFLKNEPIKAIEYAKESNVFIKNKSFGIQRDNLEKIAKGYKLIGDNEKALLYLEEAAEISDIITKRTLAREINNIDAKHNVAREQIKTLKEKNKRQLLLYSSLFLITLLIIISSLNYIRSKSYKRRFNQLIEDIEPKSKTTLVKNKKLSGVPSKIVKNLLQELEAFERKNSFLTKNLTLNQVAEELQTNPTYLSKIINFYKGKNFTSYLNEARINYAIHRLKNDKKFQHYTIKAIAYDSGFSNTESFSLIFHKNTGLYPSYFIKQLQKISE